MKTQLTSIASMELLKEYKGFEIYNANTHFMIIKIEEWDYQIPFDNVIDAENHIDRLVERDKGFHTG